MVSNITRISYLVRTNEPKINNQPLNANDYMNIGYMAGRFGVNLSNNPMEANPMVFAPQGTFVNINSCTSDLFEQNLAQTGVRFDRIA